METPFFLFGTVDFNGSGSIISPSGTLSTLGSNLEFTGSYTVNADCTGTMTLNSSLLSTSTSTGTTGMSTSSTSSSALSLSFVLVQPTVPFTPGSTTASRSLGPEIEFSMSSSGTQTLSGYGLPQ
jgi:hypothetical protein